MTPSLLDIPSSLFTYDTKKNKAVEKAHRRVNVFSNKGTQIFLQDHSQWFLVWMNTCVSYIENLKIWGIKLWPKIMRSQAPCCLITQHHKPSAIIHNYHQLLYSLPISDKVTTDVEIRPIILMFRDQGIQGKVLCKRDR